MVEYASDQSASDMPYSARWHTQPHSATGFGCFGCRLWLQQLGGLQQRGKLVGTLAVVGVIAAVVVGGAGLGIDEAERRFGDIGRRGQSCSQRVIGVSCIGSCPRLPKAFSTLGGLIRTYVTRHTRTCASAVAVCPLRRARCRDRSRSSIVAHKCSGKR